MMPATGGRFILPARARPVPGRRLRRQAPAGSLAALSLAALLGIAGPAASQDEVPGEDALIDIQPADEAAFGVGLGEAPDRIVFPGSTAVSGFSGTTIPGIEEGLPPDIDPVDETFIDTLGATLRIFDLSVLGAGPAGQLVYPPLSFEVTAGQIGQVFALAYDDGMRDGEPSGVSNLYAAATSLNGIQIVTADEDGDGRPERRSRGRPGAVFMAGQFGEENGGGPGAIWKIDGLTGAVTLFSSIEANSGPGLGDVSFDRGSRQFFVSDLDTGLIHRIDAAAGTLLDAFDHGVEGRRALGLEAVADDGAVMDTEGAAFDSEDPGSWGLTQDERRVWAVAAHGGRVYYAVGQKAEIWSVGIAAGGAFAGDPRRELTVAATQALAVTDIAFDGSGFMYLAQRGEPASRLDYSRFARSGRAEVLRYWRESPDDPATESIWTPAPDTYATGFPEGNRQAAGGIDLQYGYDRLGFFEAGACSDTLLATGDRLRDDPALADRLGAGGPAAVHGMQVTATRLPRPGNEPPFGSWFIDSDGFFEDPEAEGHVGDVEVWRPCEGGAGIGEEVQGGFMPPVYPPQLPPGDAPLCLDIAAVRYFCTPAGLEAELHVRDVAGIGGDSVMARSLSAGTGVSPLRQTVAPGAPFTIGLSGHLPGETVDVGLCYYRRSDADQGGYHPCCRVVVPLTTPAPGCEP